MIISNLDHIKNVASETSVIGGTGLVPAPNTAANVTFFLSQGTQLKNIVQSANSFTANFTNSQGTGSLSISSNLPLNVNVATQ